MRDRRGIGLAAAFALAASLGAAPSARALTLSLDGGGLVSEPANFACSGSPCLANETFDLLSPGAVSGTLEIDLAAHTASILLSVPSFSFDGSFGGVDEIRFTNVTYSALVNVSVSGDVITGGGQLGTVTGSYEQLSGGATVVGPTAFSEQAYFLALNCSVPGGMGICALQVGTGTAGQYDLDIHGAGPNRFINSFNAAVVPEPSANALFVAGLLIASGARRRARA
jgi:hypothetical protein